MGRRATGEFTIPGFLTHRLQDLGLTRKELAERVGVSVRTIHNIEHGRKRVDPRSLARVAEVLNAFLQEIHPAAKPLGLTKDHFIKAPSAVISVVMQAVTRNRPDFLLDEDAPVASEMRWWVNGDPERLSWVGDFDLASVRRQIDAFHQCFEFLGIEGPQIHLYPQQFGAVIKTVSNIRHPHTAAQINYKSFIELDLTGSQLNSLEATFDSARVAAFLETGRPSRLRRESWSG